MAKFNYKLVNKENKIIGGSVSTLTKGRAKEMLEKDGSTVLFIARDENSLWHRKIIARLLGFSTQDRISFFRNLGTMLTAGVPIAETLRVIGKQTKSDKAKQAINAMVNDIENGKQLSGAMEKFSDLFSPFLIETVRVGEITGRLTRTLDRISVDLEKDYELQREVKSQMAYPLVVIIVMIVVLTIMVLYVLPKIADLFTELNLELPLPTRILLGGGVFVQNYYAFIIGGIITLIAGFFLLLRNKKARYTFHYAILKMPIFGEIIKETNLVFFFRSLESLLASGVSFPRGIEVAKKTLNNDVYQQALEKMQPLLLQGVPFADTLKPFPFLFPLEIQSMIEVGGRVGKLEESFIHVSSYYERSLRTRTKTLTSLVEPILMIFTGIVVGIIALSVFLPIYQTAYTNIL